MLLIDREFTVPLDHQAPQGATIKVYGREVVAPTKQDAALPWLVFLQGGPGFGAPRPMAASGWLGLALEHYRVLLLDQRGTGRSTPANARSLAGRSPREQASYLKHFRADSIVRDCELIRRRLLGDGGKWSVLGQSYGGFCTVTYLSLAPDGLREAFITGGLPPLDRTADDVYRQTYATVALKNERYYQRYPDDVARVHAIVECLERGAVRLPSGDRLTTRKFAQLGLNLGMSDGYEVIHYLLEDAFIGGPSGPEPSYAFVHGFEHTLPYQTNPIFAILHEAAYAQGQATNWSAARIRAEFPQFERDPKRPFLLTGEMIYPWMFEEYGALAPLREAAQILAEDAEWPRLYDVDVLRGNQVPSAAVVYYDDMYIAREYSIETANEIRGLKWWITNEYEHNGLRAEGDRVFGRLLKAVRGEI